jgi:hypothetical protein
MNNKLKAIIREDDWCCEYAFVMDTWAEPSATLAQAYEVSQRSIQSWRKKKFECQKKFDCELCWGRSK